MMKTYKDQLCRKIDKYEIISFDVFDTLLLRDVLHPTDIFEVVEKYDSQIGFKKKRILAEKKARKASTDEDVSLDDIYKFIDVSSEYELNREVEFLRVNDYMLEVFEYAKSLNKTILIITDMYLPRGIIEKLLESNGVVEYDSLYISNEIGKTKASGNLYDHISAELNLSKSEWLHVGDNWISDCINANKFGISYYHYKPLGERFPNEKKYNIAYSIMKAIQINHMSYPDVDYWKKFGILNVSSIMWGFTTWIAESLSEKKSDNITFLSRDGYLPYLVYKKLRNENDTLPEGKYIYASRRAYQFPNIINMDKESAVKVLTAFNNSLGQQLTIGEVLNNIGLKYHNYKELLIEYGFNSKDSVIKTFKEHYKVQSFLILIYDDITNMLENELNYVKKYLVQEGITDYDSLNIVDIGWRGSTQKSIQDILETPTYGYYFGTNAEVYKDIKDHTQGYAFNLGKNKKRCREILDNIMMFEFVFSSPENSLLSFTEYDNAVLPCFSSMSDNSVTSNAQQLIRSGVLEIIDSYLLKKEYLCNLTVTDVTIDYRKFLLAKNYQDLLAFSELTAFVGIGESENCQKYVSVLEGSKFIENKKKNIRESNSNMWKGAMIVLCSGSDFGFYLFNRMDELMKRVKFVFIHRVIKGILNPQKAIKYLLKNK